VLVKKQEKPQKMPNMAELLRRVDIFGDLDDSILNKLVKIATMQQFHNEETITLAGDNRKVMFFIIRGQAKILCNSKNARNGILSLLDIGDFFGEIHFFNRNTANPFSVKAEGECLVIILRGEDFKDIMINNPKLSSLFIEKLTQKLNRAYMQIASISMNTIKRRIKSCIMQFIDERGIRTPVKNGKSTTILRNRPTQQQIAEMTGTTRETVNRELAVLVKDGYIELDGKDLILLKELSI
jgi:CRP-like cAMP-binding protein